MSYILEALKKLEQKRQQEKNFTFLTLQGQVPGAAKKRRIWPYVLCAALFVNAGAIVWWIGPWKEGGKIVPHEQPRPKAVSERQAAVGAPPTTSAGARGEETKKAVEAKATEKPAVERPVKEAGPAHGAAEKKKATAQKRASEAVEQAEAEPHTPPEPKPPADRRVFRITELPSMVSKELPELKMSLHYYIAEPHARFARINDKTLKEGQSLAQGLKVDEITATGVVMNFKGWRFQIGINESR